MTLIWTDNPRGPDVTLIPQNTNVDLGTAQQPFNNLYVNNVVASLEVLANNAYLESTDNAGTGVLGLIKGTTGDNTRVNAKTAKVIEFAVNDVAIGTASATALTYPIFDLSDGADKNHSVTSYGSGTGYTLTATPAAVVQGTSSVSLVLDKAGTYLLLCYLNLQYVGATFAANRTVTLQINRTNNTPGVLTGSATALGTNIVTTVSGTMVAVTIPVVVTTANTNDILVPFASVSVGPTAGSLQATESWIIAHRLY